MASPEQLRFFEQLRRQLPAHLNLAAWLQAALGLNRDAVYRRLRGQTSLSIDEYLLLCQQSGLPLSCWQQPASPVEGPPTLTQALQSLAA